MMAKRNRAISLEEIAYRIMQYHFRTNSWKMDKRTFENECSIYDRSDILLAQGNRAQRVSIPREISEIDQLDTRCISFAQNPLLAKNISSEINAMGCKRRHRSSFRKGTLEQRDAKFIYEAFRQNSNLGKLSIEGLRLKSTEINSVCNASTLSEPLSYSSVSNRIELLCAANKDEVIPLSFPLGASNHATDRAQDIIEMISKADICTNIKDIGQECIAIPSYVLSQILELFLLRINSSDAYRQFCAEKLAGFSIIDEASLFHGEDYEGILFDGYGEPTMPAVVTSKSLRQKYPFGQIGETDPKLRILGRSLTMIYDIPFGVPGWIDLRISRPSTIVSSPKLRVISASSILPQSHVDKATLVAFVEKSGGAHPQYEICTMSFSITDMLTCAKIEDSFKVSGSDGSLVQLKGNQC